MCYETIDHFRCGHDKIQWGSYCKSAKEKDGKKVGTTCPNYRFFRRGRNEDYCDKCSGHAKEQVEKDRLARENEELKRKRKEAKRNGKGKGKEKETEPLTTPLEKGKGKA